MGLGVKVGVKVGLGVRVGVGAGLLLSTTSTTSWLKIR
jgi:hypothetical protein